MTSYFLNLFILFSNIHPNHISNTEVVFNDSTKTFEISIKVIPDDFENALKKNCHSKIDLIKQEYDSSTIDCVVKYFENNFSIETGKKKIELNFLGYEFKEKEFYIFLESEKIESPKYFVINNSILYENSKLQVNIVRCKIGKKDLSVRLKNPESKWVVK